MRTTPARRANVELGGKNGGVILNISETGMAVATADPLAVNDSFACIRFQLPSSGQSIEVSAQIVWLAESKKSAGVRFVDLAAEVRNQISNWISSERQAPECEASTPALVENLLPAIVESLPEEPTGSVLPEQDEPSLPELIAHAAPQSSEIVTLEIQDANPPLFVEDLQGKVHHHVPVGGYAPQVRTRKLEPPVDRIENSNSLKYALEISGLQVVAFASAFLLAVIGLTVALTVGRGPLGTRLRNTQKTTLADDAKSPALPNRPGEASSQMSPLAASKAEESRSENPSAPSPKARPEDSANHVRSTGPSFESFAKIPSTNSNSPPALESKPSVRPEPSPWRNGTAGLTARNAPPIASPGAGHSPKAVGPISGPPRNPAPRRVEPSTGVSRHRSPPSTVLVTAPARGSKPFRVTFAEKPIAASSSFAMTSELSVLIAPQPGPAAAHRPSRLQAGELVSYVWPRYPKAGDRYGSAEIIKVRATIGQLGQVLDIKLLSGPNSLLPATMSAIRQWRYRPTLLNKRPVQVQQDITIEFRPPQYLSQARAQHPAHD